MKNLDLKKRLIIATGILVALIISITLGMVDSKEAAIQVDVLSLPSINTQQTFGYLSKMVLSFFRLI
jgi:hypothetical protein